MGTIDHSWSKMCEWRRQDSSGGWETIPIEANMEVQPQEPHPAKVPEEPGATDTVMRAYRSIVSVRVEVPIAIDGVLSTSIEGCGYVVDVERGLILTDRNTTICPICDVRVTIFGSVEVPARLLFLHPTHGYGIIQADLRGQPVTAIRLASKPPTPGKEYLAVGVAHDSAAVTSKMTVMRRKCHYPNDFSTPMHRVVNEEYISLDKQIKYTGGLILDLDASTGAAAAASGPAGAAD